MNVSAQLVLVADESVPRPIIERLRSVDDTAVLDIASQRDAVVVTEDKDFGDLVYQRQLPLGSGVILLRLSGLSTQDKCDRTAAAVASHASQIKGAFTVISARSVRVRKLS